MRCTATFGFVLIVVCIQLQLGVTDKIPSPVGETYYLTKVDILGDRLFGGSPVLNISKKCFVCEPLEILDDSSVMFENTGVFYSSITSSYDLGGELRRDFTLGFTLDQTTGMISQTNRTVKGATLDIKSETSKCKVKPECLYNEDLHDLSPGFISEFMKLPRKVVYLDDRDEWNFTAYERFLNEFGSHIVTGVTYGSRMYQHCFSKEEKDYNARDYTVRACVAFAGGNNITGANISTCAGISQEEAEQSNTLDVSLRLVLRGGTLETRAALSQERTTDLIIQFLKEANVTDQPIEYDFTAVWTLLGQKFIGTEHYAKVRNLEAYYLGLKNFNCPRIWTPKYGNEGKWALQGFGTTDYSTDEVPSFQCYIPYSGCHSSDDCHYKAGIWCECSGNLCFKSETKTLNTGEEREYMRVVKNEGMSWNGCHLSWGCSCQNANRWDWRSIWEQDKDGADNGKMLHLLHHNLNLQISKRAHSSSKSEETTRDERDEL